MKHNNPTISQDMNRLLDLKGESTSEVADFIQPTIEVMRHCNICRTAGQTASGAITTLYTTPADKDFYLSAAQIGLSNDAAWDAATGGFALRVTIEGVSRDILNLPFLTLTGGRSSISQVFPIPIKLDRNTILTTSANPHTAGNCSKVVCIQGYTVETTKGV